MKKSQLHNICHSKELRAKGGFCRAREDQTRKTTPAAAIRLVSNHSLDAIVGFAVAGGYVAEDSRGREGRRRVRSSTARRFGSASRTATAKVDVPWTKRRRSERGMAPLRVVVASTAAR